MEKHNELQSALSSMPQTDGHGGCHRLFLHSQRYCSSRMPVD